MSFGKITDEGVEKLRSRIGVERKGSTMHRRGPLKLSGETINRFALGCGDDNPVYIDREYAESTRHGARIAPASISGYMERSNGASDGFPGCHTIWRDAKYEWNRSMREGDVLDSSSYLRKVEIIPSKFGGGRAAVMDYETEIVDAEGEPLGRYDTSWHRFERSSAKKASTLKKRELPMYTPDDIERIKGDYRKEKRRGADTLHWEEVQLEEEIPFVVKGPTTQISKFAFESWQGASGWFVGHKFAFDMFDKHPGLPFINEQGIPEAPVAIHWSNERSQKILGLPGAYEAGYERTSWIVHMLQNWMGDDGHLYTLTQKYPTFNLLGDTSWCHGTVREKFLLDEPVDGKRHAVRCDIWSINQRGDITTTGQAVVLLPGADGNP
ncbi:MAG: MaoC family dehydratase N-terminal domain-containing protein [Candidatus Binatia bacterium]|nr:MaoC family dehydratase N-terminal domain-containing protein [Candidatus Binatia bacterium]